MWLSRKKDLVILTSPLKSKQFNYPSNSSHVYPRFYSLPFLYFTFSLFLHFLHSFPFLFHSPSYFLPPSYPFLAFLTTSNSSFFLYSLLTFEALMADVNSKPWHDVQNLAGIDEIVGECHKHLNEIFDKYAPSLKKCVIKPPAPCISNYIYKFLSSWDVQNLLYTICV